jgi:hypothetical protein
MPSRLAHEAATGVKLLDTELPVVGYITPTHSNMLVDTAKRLQRLQTKRSKLRRELKTVEAEIKMRRRELKALCAEVKRGS